MQHPFVVKVLERLGIQGTCLNMIKTVYSNDTANINLNRRNSTQFH